nr:MAG TPA: hypothetical protein [Caudoviricetes sp.]
MNYFLNSHLTSPFKIPINILKHKNINFSLINYILYSL